MKLNNTDDGWGRPRAIQRFALLVCTALAFAGCGSTVQRTVSASSTTSTDNGLGAASAPPSAQQPQSGTPVDAGAAIVGAQRAGATSAVAGTGLVNADSLPRTRGGAVPLTGRGWDAKNVYIGVVTQKDTQKVFAAFGANNVDPGDTEAQATAAADAVNRRDGVLGRQIKLRFYDIQTIATAQNGSTVGEAACTHFTQDALVIAVWNLSTQLDQVPTFRGCLAKAHVPFFTAAARAIDDAEMNVLRPFYYHTLMVSWDRLAPVFAARLKAQGYFGGWNTTLGRPGSGKARVGILTDDSPQGTHTAAVLKSAIARVGYPDSIVYQYGDPSQGQASSVNFFKGNGVTHVIVTDVELTAFQNAAASQHYEPRYGITTYNDPYSNLEASGLTPTGANNGAVGVGWAPTFDVSQANDPGATRGTSDCLKTMVRGGQTFGTKRLAQAYASSLCDTMNLVSRGAAVGGGFTADAIYAGMMRIGPGFSPAIGFAPGLTPSKLYVPGAVRDIVWIQSCSCMRYGKATATL